MKSKFIKLLHKLIYTFFICMLCMIHPTAVAMDGSSKSTPLEPIPEISTTEKTNTFISLANYRYKKKCRDQKYTAYIDSKAPIKKINPFITDKNSNGTPIETDEHWLEKEFRELQEKENARYHCCAIQ